MEEDQEGVGRWPLCVELAEEERDEGEESCGARWPPLVVGVHRDEEGIATAPQDRRERRGGGEDAEEEGVG